MPKKKKENVDELVKDTRPLATQMELFYQRTDDLPLNEIFPWINARHPRDRKGLYALMQSMQQKGFMRGIGAISVNEVAEPKKWATKEVDQCPELEGQQKQLGLRKYGTIDGRSRWSVLWYSILDKFDSNRYSPVMTVPCIVYQNLPERLALTWAQSANFSNEIFLATRVGDRLVYIKRLEAALKAGNIVATKKNLVEHLLNHERGMAIKIGSRLLGDIVSLAKSVHEGTITAMSRLYNLDPQSTVRIALRKTPSSTSIQTSCH